MNLKEYAAMLNGKQYGYPQFSQEEIDIAKQNGIVIVHGASDDLIEYNGAIYDEDGCYDGGIVYLTPNGIDTDGVPINVKWCEDKDDDGMLITWTYETEIPYETFMIYEDDEPYCKGMVFYLKDLEDIYGKID